MPAATLALLACVLLVPATAAAHKPPNRPLVFAVVVDGLDGDEVDAGQAPFLSSLIAGKGANTTYYQESRSVMVAETNPNHAAMMTGAYTDRSGIAGNSFAIYSDLKDEEDNEADNCIRTGRATGRALPTETTGEHPSCVLAETVYQAVVNQGNPEAYATAGIFGKAKLARIFGAQRRNGAFVANHLWAPCTPDDTETERRYCATVPIEPINNDRTISDTLVMDEVIRSVREGVGHDQRPPDFSLVNLPNVDNAGHAFGGGGMAYELAITMADREIERLVTELRRQDLWSRSVLIVLSDHSHQDTPNSLTMTNEFEDAGISPERFMVIDNGGADMVYLANRKARSRHFLLKQMRQVALATPGVELALYRRPNPLDGGRAHTIDGRFPAWNAGGPRTGDLLITARPGTRFSDPSSTSNPLLGNHGSPHTTDNTFLVSGGGAHVRHAVRPGIRRPLFADRRQNPRQAENVDLASTVLGLLGLAETRRNNGRFLKEAFNKRFLPGRTRPSVEALVSANAVKVKRRRWKLRASWAPWKSVWQVQVKRSQKRWRTVRRETRKRRLTIQLKRPGTYRVRVRAISASGKKGFWTKAKTVAR